MTGQLEGLLQGIAYAAIVFAWLWVVKQIADVRARRLFDANHEIDANRNVAVALRRAGLYLGLAIGMLGALSGASASFAEDAAWLAAEGAAVAAFLFLAQFVNDAVVIHGIRNDEAVRDGNVAVGFVEMGAYVATGLIAWGSFAGEGGGFASSLVFFALGQLALLLMIALYERLTPYAVVQEVRVGNVAAGLMLGGMMVALGVILKASLKGPFTGWIDDLLEFGISAGAGIVLLLLLQWPIDRLFLPGTSLQVEIASDRNAAAIGVTVAIKIALALIIGAVLI
jgi:uncharacterized membrane protein YjfL (UPF0719 family)